MLTLSILLRGWHLAAGIIRRLAGRGALLSGGRSIFTIVMVTPSQAEYVKGLLRARKQGRDSSLLPGTTSR